MGVAARRHVRRHRPEVTEPYSRTHSLWLRGNTGSRVGRNSCTTLMPPIPTRSISSIASLATSWPRMPAMPTRLAAQQTFFRHQGVEALGGTVHRRQGRPESEVECSTRSRFQTPLFVAQPRVRIGTPDCQRQMPATDPHTVPHGMSTRPPFYKIDWNAKRSSRANR